MLVEQKAAAVHLSWNLGVRSWSHVFWLVTCTCVSWVADCGCSTMAVAMNMATAVLCCANTPVTMAPRHKRRHAPMTLSLGFGLGLGRTEQGTRLGLGLGG